MHEQYERRRVTVAAFVSAVLERFASSEGSPRFGLTFVVCSACTAWGT
jgi:hypothetical protein